MTTESILTAVVLGSATGFFMWRAAHMASKWRQSMHIIEVTVLSYHALDRRIKEIEATMQTVGMDDAAELLHAEVKDNAAFLRTLNEVVEEYDTQTKDRK